MPPRICNAIHKHANSRNANNISTIIQIRKTARLRREYLHKRTLQEAERERLDRKIRIREALEKGIPLSRKDLQDEVEEQEYGVHCTVSSLCSPSIVTIFSIELTVPLSLSFSLPVNSCCFVFLDSLDKLSKKQQLEIELDNEYTGAGLEDPKIILTTARNPSDRLKRFMKELRIMLPNAQRMNRGTQQLKDLVQTCIQSGFTDFIMVNETNGEPSSITISHLPYGPTASFTVYNTVMRHDTNAQDTISQAYPHLIFHNFRTNLGKRVMTILKHLFPVPKADSQRVITFANDNDFISFRHHVYKMVDGKIHLKEIGPRFEMQLYEVRLGTVDQTDAEREWVLRPYMNTASKRQWLGRSAEELEAEKEEELTQLRE